MHSFREPSLVVVTLLFVFSLDSVTPSKILYIFPVGCRSTTTYHFNNIKLLTNRGHQVWAFGGRALPEYMSNVTDINIHTELYDLTDNVSFSYDFIGTFANTLLAFEIQYANCEKTYLNEKTKYLMKNGDFDLVIMELDSTDCFFPIAFHFGAPVIGISTAAIMYSEYDNALGNPINPSYVPLQMSGFSGQMEFWQRVSNTLQYLVYYSFIKLKYMPQINSMVRKYVKDTSRVEDLVGNFSLVFYDTHFSFLPRALSPNTVEIGGIHIKEPAPLPMQIRNFIDNAENGVILISLGSLIKFSSLPEALHRNIVHVISKLPYHFLWRHDKPEMIPDTAKNILAMNWLPQADILAEEKTVLFISHSGIYSTYEAIHYGIPILALPVFYDQFTNAAIIEKLGIGLKLEFQNTDGQLFETKIKQILNDERYKEKAQDLSKTFRDRPQSSAELFIYWSEYVIRHKGAPHLQTVGSKLPVYQYLLLDVILFFLLILFVLMYCLYLSIRIFYKLLFFKFMLKEKQS